jgi:AsmA family
VAAHLEGGTLRFLRGKRGVVIAAIVLVVALFLIRPGAGRLRTRIVQSISLALGRPVDVTSVSVQLLPQPGFDLQNFVVHEDPAFGTEPLLRAGEVTATLRVMSLLRGRLEIARLSLTEPSLNLVQNSSGHWNLEKLLERADKTPVAPTSKSRTERRPGFPYIEADRGRINFKFGQEKKPYALTDADFSVWQDSENAWGLRLQARPVRTDFNLSDTGTIRVEGSWQRAATLRQTPLQFELAWEQGQLGQATKLIYGNDKGWRGTIALSARLTGTPADLSIRGKASVDSFRRYDLTTDDALRLVVNCDARYSSVDRSLPSVSCQAPVGDGLLSLEGSVAGSTGASGYGVALRAQDVPMQSLVEFARHTKKNIPDDLAATGRLDASFQLKPAGRRQGGHMQWTGGGQTRGFVLRSQVLKTELLAEKIPFSLSMASNPRVRVDTRSGSSRNTVQIAAESQLNIGPFSLSLGRPAPASMSARFSRLGYKVEIKGDTAIQRLLQLADVLGLPAARPAADGAAKVDLQIAGAWSAFAAPSILGTAQLQAVRAEIRGLNQPLEIASANVVLTPSEAEVKSVAASVAGSAWRGSLVVPRGCESTALCPIHFVLHADTISTDKLSQAMDPRPVKRPWYRFLSSTSRPANSFLRSLHATGRITASRVLVHKLAASHVSANVELEDGKLQLSLLQGGVLGGWHVGEWRADFTGKVPEYSGSGTLQQVALGQIAQAMHDPWITGVGNTSYHARMSGLTTSELISSANASLQVEALDGTLPHLALVSGAGPLHLRRFAGRLFFRDRKLEIAEGKLETPENVYQVSGTASLARSLNVKLTRVGARGFDITGTLTQPRVAEAALPETRAALKP